MSRCHRVCLSLIYECQCDWMGECRICCSTDDDTNCWEGFQWGNKLLSYNHIFARCNIPPRPQNIYLSLCKRVPLRQGPQPLPKAFTFTGSLVSVVLMKMSCCFLPYPLYHGTWSEARLVASVPAALQIQHCRLHIYDPHNKKCATIMRSWLWVID